MHPIVKCCGYYCACLAILGVVFFSILIALVHDANPFLVRHQDEAERRDKIEALVIAIVANSICFVLCAGCVCFTKYKESKTATDDNDDDDIPLAPRQFA